MPDATLRRALYQQRLKPVHKSVLHVKPAFEIIAFALAVKFSTALVP